MDKIKSLVESRVQDRIVINMEVYKKNGRIYRTRAEALFKLSDTGLLIDVESLFENKVFLSRIGSELREILFDNIINIKKSMGKEINKDNLNFWGNGFSHPIKKITLKNRYILEYKSVYM